MNVPAATLRPADHHAGAAPRALTGLLVAADPAAPVRLVTVADTAVAISDVLGSVLLDDVVTWATPGGARVGVYLAEDRAAGPDNPRLSLVTTRLGLTDRAFHASLRGDALILGSGPTGADEDLDPDVVVEVGRSGITVECTQDLTAAARSLPGQAGQAGQAGPARVRRAAATAAAA